MPEPLIPDPACAWFVVRLEAFPTKLATLLDGLTPDDMERRGPAAQWSAREQLAHLGRYHEVFLERLRRMRTEDAPRLPRYRTEEDPGFAAWTALEEPALREALLARRQELVEAVRGMPAAELGRVGVHPVYGAMPLARWLEFFFAHEGHHLYVALLRARGG